MIAVIGWLLGLLLIFHEILLSGLSRTLFNLDDVRLVNFILEHGYRWVAGYPLDADLWSPPLFHPLKGVGAFAEPLLAVGPFYWAYRGAGFAPDVAYLLWIFTIWSLNYLAAWLLLTRSFRFGSFGAACGALLFAFGNARVAQMIEQQLIPGFWILLAIGALLALFAREPLPRGAALRWIALFYAALVLQYYTAFYPFYFLCLSLGIAILWSLVLPEPRRRLLGVVREHWPALLAGAVLALAAVAPLLLRQLAVASELGLREYRTNLMPRLASWFLMGEDNWLYGWLQAPGGPFEELHRVPHSNGVGPLTTLVALVGLWRARQRPGVRLIVAASVSALALATIWPGGFTLWHWAHDWIPGAAALRAVARIAMVLLLPLTIGIAAAFEGLLAPGPSRTGRVVLTIALLAACGAEQVNEIRVRDRLEVRRSIERLAKKVGPDCDAFLLVSRGPRPYRLVHDDAAWVALATGVPTINGRYGQRPKGWRLSNLRISSPEDQQRVERALDSWVEQEGLDASRICWIERRTRGG